MEKIADSGSTFVTLLFMGVLGAVLLVFLRMDGGEDEEEEDEGT